MRINKFLANCGIASRRKSESLIIEGKVKVNGEPIIDLATQIDENTDIVEVDGKVVAIENDKKIYILLNKPEGYITTAKDQFGRKSVMDLVTDIGERIYPVGRLDYETSGLLIMTNDGDLTYRLTHPKHEVDKIYLASVKGIITKEEIEIFENGMEIDDYITAKARLKVIKTDESKNYSVCKVKIHEGHNRQVRKMLEKIGHPVMNLRRIQLGKIKLNKLEVGKYRHLSEEEVRQLINDSL